MEKKNIEISRSYFDVVVLGAGPAGVAAAITSQNAGLNVCVICKEQQQETGKDRPLQSVHPGVLTILNQLGLQDALKQSSKSTFTGIEVNGRLNKLSPEEDEWYGHHIDRYLFDKAILGVLKEKSISIIQTSLLKRNIQLENETVSIKITDNTSVTASYCIDATGNKRISKSALDVIEKVYSAPLHCWTGVCKAEAIQVQDREKTSFNTQTNGWLWLVPNNENAITWTKLIIDKREENSIPFTKENQLNKVTANNVRWRALRPICTDQVLLCGDAAGIVDPAAGQGILNALMSGVMVAQCVISCIRQPQLKGYFYTSYDQWFIQRFEDMILVLNEYYKELQLDAVNRFIANK